MRIIFTADTHIGLDHPQHPRHPRRHRGPDFLRNFTAVVDHAITTRADVLLHGGDVFDVAGVPAFLVDAVYQALLRAAEHGIHVGIIAGNHERSVLPMALLLAHPRVHVFHGAGMHVFETGAGRVAVLGVPFVKGDVRALLWEQCARHPWPSGASFRVAMLHQPVEGAQVGPVGYTFRNRADTIPASGIPPDVDVVLSGHIHRAQVLWMDHGSRQVPVVYPGSVERASFAERGETKAFVELVLSGGKRALRHIPLPARPMVDVHVSGITRGAVGQCLSDAVASLPQDAVLRMLGRAESTQLITARLLDETVPFGMSVAHAWQPAPG